jgi:hypothetical protein
MRSEEAQLGKRVRVREDHCQANLRGREGTIAKRWGNPCYVALDVLFDDGDWQLFWHHELEEVDEDDRGTRPQDQAVVGPRTQDPSPPGPYLVDVLKA